MDVVALSTEHRSAHCPSSGRERADGCGAATEPMVPSGRSVIVCEPSIPLVRHYHVVSWPIDVPRPSATEIDEMFVVVHALARRLGHTLFGDDECGADARRSDASFQSERRVSAEPVRQCFTVLFNGQRTGRRPWPHFHVILARTPFEKWRTLLFLLMKRRLRRWRRVIARVRSVLS